MAFPYPRSTMALRPSSTVSSGPVNIPTADEPKKKLEKT
jgi:hypothetical protein